MFLGTPEILFFDQIFSWILFLQQEKLFTKLTECRTQIAVNRGNVSYPQALKNAITPPNAIRNINIPGDDPENSANIVALIRKGD